MDQALELVGWSLFDWLDAKSDFPCFVPPATHKLVLVLSHDKNTSQVRYFLSFLFIAHKHFRALRQTGVDDDRSDDEGEGDNDKQE
jgi:hypothetical protein